MHHYLSRLTQIRSGQMTPDSPDVFSQILEDYKATLQKIRQYETALCQAEQVNKQGALKIKELEKRVSDLDEELKLERNSALDQTARVSELVQDMQNLRSETRGRKFLVDKEGFVSTR